MRIFTKEDFKKLEPLESHLQRGFYGKYYYGLTRHDFNAMLDVYRDLGFTKAMQYSCGACILELTKTLGRYYFEFKKQMENEEKEVPKNAKRTVNEYDSEGNLLNTYQSVTEAIEKTNVSKSQIYKALKEGTAIDGKKFQYV